MFRQIPSPDEKLVLNAVEAGALVGRSSYSLERWRREGKGPPFIRMGGGRVGYPAAALREWAEKGDEAVMGQAPSTTAVRR